MATALDTVTESPQAKLRKAQTALDDVKQTIRQMKELLGENGMGPMNREDFIKRFNLTPEQQIRFIKDFEEWANQLENAIQNHSKQRTNREVAPPKLKLTQKLKRWI